MIAGFLRPGARSSTIRTRWTGSIGGMRVLWVGERVEEVEDAVAGAGVASDRQAARAGELGDRGLVEVEAAPVSRVRDRVKCVGSVHGEGSRPIRSSAAVR